MIRNVLRRLIPRREAPTPREVDDNKRAQREAVEHARRARRELEGLRAQIEAYRSPDGR